VPIAAPAGVRRRAGVRGCAAAASVTVDDHYGPGRL